MDKVRAQSHLRKAQWVGKIGRVAITETSEGRLRHPVPERGGRVTRAFL